MPREEHESSRRKWLITILAAILLALAGVVALFARYLRQPAPLPDIVAPQLDLFYPPHYLFSIYGVNKPVGVAVSPRDDRIYVSETSGERLIRVFDREGVEIGSFVPPTTQAGERSPVYLTTDNDGRVFVTDRLQHAVFIYDRDGRYMDTILSPDLTLSEYVAKEGGGQLLGGLISYNLFQGQVNVQPPGAEETTLSAPSAYSWSPLGIRINQTGTIILTDVAKDQNRIRELSVYGALNLQPGIDFNPSEVEYGASGQGNGEFLFPNTAMSDSQGRVYTSDGNNGRIVVWDEQKGFLFNFGTGSGDGAVSLPRGLYIDSRDRLYVVDAVGQNVKVYDVSGTVPEFLFTFGDFGQEDGFFNYPNDIAVDGTGRLYIVDRENNRVQVWSY